MKLVGKDVERVPAHLGAKPEAKPSKGSLVSARVAHMGFESPIYRASPAKCTVHGASGIVHHQELTTPDRGWARGLPRAAGRAMKGTVKGEFPYR